MADFFSVIPPVWWTIFAVIVGLCVGSFLNVVIYRLPRGLSVSSPKRSFCPQCNKEIAWYRNIPVVTWLLQGGRSSCCEGRIPARYLFVELITGALFGLTWWYFSWPVNLCFLLWIALLIAGSFVDLEHLLLPDFVTIGGLVLGLVASVLVPEIHGETQHLLGLRSSFFGAGFGFLLLLAVWQLGKWAFGRIRVSLEKAEPFTIEEKDEKILFSVAEESLDWGEIFARKSDRLRIEASNWSCVNLQGKVEKKGKKSQQMLLSREEVFVGDFRCQLSCLSKISGKTNAVVIPREALGFGDVILVAMLGAWCGWQGTLFVLGAGAILGLFVGLPLRLLAQKEQQIQLPFGPFLALAALLWVFGGKEVVEAYFSYLLF